MILPFDVLNYISVFSEIQLFNAFIAAEMAKEEINLVDQYSLACSGTVEHNQIYVIFSPTPFVKAVDNIGGKYMPRQLDYMKFKEWLSNCKKLDPKMSVKILHMEIRP